MNNDTNTITNCTYFIKYVTLYSNQHKSFASKNQKSFISTISCHCPLYLIHSQFRSLSWRHFDVLQRVFFLQSENNTKYFPNKCQTKKRRKKFTRAFFGRCFAFYQKKFFDLTNSALYLQSTFFHFGFIHVFILQKLC